jgi:hypothetical protein
VPDRLGELRATVTARDLGAALVAEALLGLFGSGPVGGWRQACVAASMSAQRR